MPASKSMLLVEAAKQAEQVKGGRVMREATVTFKANVGKDDLKRKTSVLVFLGWVSSPNSRQCASPLAASISGLRNGIGKTFFLPSYTSLTETHS